MRQLRRLADLAILSAGISAIASCDPIPPLHLHYEQDVDFEFPLVMIDLDVIWDYDLMYEYQYDTVYDWRKEWKYGWDDQDSILFGPIGYTAPEAFNIRRYYQANVPDAPHINVQRDYFEGYSFTTSYQFGYYDFLLWNDIITKDGTYSVIFDEETSLDSVMVASTSSTYGPSYDPGQKYSYNMPDELFSAEMQDIYISRNKEDYDRYDEVTNTYYKYLDLTLYPRTYIYLTQVIIHHNWGKVVGTDGNANLSNMARTTNLNTGVAGNDPVTVHYNTRFKQNVEYTDYFTRSKRWGDDDQVDIIGGRLTTFGIRSINPYHYSNPLQIPEPVRKQRHYLDVNMIFGNGCDTTFVFDVTDQVLKRFRGGVITVELDLDTIHSPGRNGGSGFDAEVEEWGEETHEFEVINP